MMAAHLLKTATLAITALALAAPSAARIARPMPRAPETGALYFPLRLSEQGPSCEPVLQNVKRGTGGEAVPYGAVDRFASSSAADEFKARWYSGHLVMAGEPSLTHAATQPRAAGAQTLRFLWVRSFDAPIIIRVEWESARKARLIAVRLGGTGGYGPEAIADKIDRALDAREVRGLKKAMARNTVFDPSSLPPCMISSDGAQWVFEAVDARGYHFTDRRSPESGPVRELGLHLIKLTGWDVGNVY